MKIKVNNKEFDIEIFGNKAIINENLEKKIEIKDDTLIIDNKEFFIDYYEEKEEESLLIINGMAVVVSKKTIDEQIIKEIKSPIKGEIKNILVQKNQAVKSGETMIILK